ncbi:MAG TPA: response regulator [Pseudomonas aeruginosa]|nr:response regulator [Pseudomonas aeruginosa]
MLLLKSSIAQKGKILIVDDQPIVVKILERLLSFNGLKVDYALKPEEAIDKLSKYRYDLLLCDYDMPGMKGTEILQYSYKVAPDTIRILITGYREFDVILEAVNKSKIYYCILKPWENDELLKIIDTALKEKSERCGSQTGNRHETITSKNG